MVVNTTSATNCCIACQNQPFCAGSFFAPSVQACHLQLTQAAPAPAPPSLPAPSMIAPFPMPSSNSSLPFPTASGAPYAMPGNDSTMGSPMATGLVPTGYTTLLPRATPTADMSIMPVMEPALTGTSAHPGSGTCSIGSLSLYLGVIRGQNDFPMDYAVSFSNGPCGRLSIDFEAVTPETNDNIQRRLVAIS